MCECRRGKKVKCVPPTVSDGSLTTKRRRVRQGNAIFGSREGGREEGRNS